MDPIIVLKEIAREVVIFGMCFSVAGFGLVVLLQLLKDRVHRLESRIEALEKLNIKTV